MKQARNDVKSLRENGAECGGMRRNEAQRSRMRQKGAGDDKKMVRGERGGGGQT